MQGEHSEKMLPHASQIEKLVMLVLAVNTFVVVGVGFRVNGYLVETERRLTAIETKIEMLDKRGRFDG